MNAEEKEKRYSLTENGENTEKFNRKNRGERKGFYTNHQETSLLKNLLSKETL